MKFRITHKDKELIYLVQKENQKIFINKPCHITNIHIKIKTDKKDIICIVFTKVKKITKKGLNRYILCVQLFKWNKMKVIVCDPDSGSHIGEGKYIEIFQLFTFSNLFTDQKQNGEEKNRIDR